MKGIKKKAEQAVADIVDAWMSDHEGEKREAREIRPSNALAGYPETKRNAVQPSTIAGYARLGKKLLSSRNQSSFKN